MFLQKDKKDKGVMSTLKKKTKLAINSYVGCHTKNSDTVLQYPAAQMKKRTSAASAPQKQPQEIDLLSDTGSEAP